MASTVKVLSDIPSYDSLKVNHFGEDPQQIRDILEFLKCLPHLLLTQWLVRSHCGC